MPSLPRTIPAQQGSFLVYRRPTGDRMATATEQELRLVVGVGASAGGLEAMSKLLAALPAGQGLALLFVQHLDPHRPSLIAELLQRHTSMKVVEATQGTVVTPDHVYVVPPGSDMALSGTTLALSAREPHHHQGAIDGLFESLAVARQDTAVGVLLSGSGADGTRGLQAIKAAGGITFAQTPESAQQDELLRHAIAAEVVDHVLPPDQIASELLRLARHPALLSPAVDPTGLPANEERLSDILALIFQATGTDFSAYKSSTVRRRLARRMMLSKTESLDAYAHMLEASPSEAKLLCDDILIHVTGFFRDPHVFEFLQARVFPKLLAAKSPGTPFRVWVPGCSTGEEVYSIAMALREFLAERIHQRPIQIFGSDISAASIDRARAGVYPDRALADFGEDRLKRFFHRTKTGYRIQQNVRELCVFVKHDLASDPPFTRIDLISCRNLLIYFGPALQERVLPLFHYSLNQPGFLLLGHSETIGGFSQLFALEDQAHKIYARKPSMGIRATSLPLDNRVGAPAEGMRKRLEARTVESDLQREAERLLVGKYAPPAVVVNESLEIVRILGRAGTFFELPAGKLEHDLLKLLKEELRSDVRLLLHQAKKEGTAARREGVTLHLGGERKTVNLEAIPLVTSGGQRCFVVCFEEVSALPPPEPGGEGGALASHNREVVRLREQLTVTHEYLQSIIAEHERSIEEVASANQELQSSNEELQSSNEELDTTKEEIQSANEELTTVNEELQMRNQELLQLNDDLINVFAILDMPVVIVDLERRIRRFFTPRSHDTLNLIPSDIGRAISDIRLNLAGVDIEAWLSEVIASTVPKVEQVQDRGGHWYRLHILPYRTTEGKFEGAVLSLVDVDALVRSLEETRAEEAVKRGVLEAALDAILFMNHEGAITDLNPAAERLFGYSRAQAIGQEMASLIIPERLRDQHRRGLAHYLATGQQLVLGQRNYLPGLRADGSEFPAEISIMRVPTLEPPVFTGHIRDITERVHHEEVLNVLSEASAQLVSTLNYETALKNIARLAVPRLGDMCAIELLENEKLVELAVVHGDPNKLVLARRLRREFPPTGEEPSGVHEVLRTGRSLLQAEITDEMLVAAARHPDQLQLFRDLQIGSVILVPLLAQQRAIGVISLVQGESKRHYTESDLQVAEELAHRAAIAIENARLYRRAQEAAAIVESSDDAIIGEKLDGTIISWNRAAELMYGFAATEAIGQKGNIIVPSDRREEIKEILQRVAQGERVHHQDTERIRKDGSRLSVSLSVAPIVDPSGRIIGASKIGRDITMQKRIEAERSRLLSELQDAVQAREVFLSIASHELKTPLNTLQLQTQMLLHLARKETKEVAEVFAPARIAPRLINIDRQLQRLTRLINELLDVSRITTGRLELEFEEFDLVATVAEVAGRMQEEATRVQCVLSLRFGSETLIGRWDRMRLEQVVTNLLSNALKYGPGKPVEIALSAGDDKIRLAVTDHGIGIAPEDQARLFQRFERMVSARHYGGLGLGLWIVSEIVKAHGGTISVESRLAEGSTFVVELPRNSVEEKR